MISHEYKCIFVHIPKCAGTSIESALGHLDGYEGRDGQDHRSIRLIEPLSPELTAFMSLARLSDVARRVRHHFRQGMNPNNKTTVTHQQFNDYFKFSFVRNPWARIYSMYKNVVRDEVHLSDFGVSKDITFKSFLNKFAGKGMLRPQTYWLKSSSGNYPFDFIGKFENLQEDFAKVCELLKVPLIHLPHKIKGESQDYLAHYDDQTHSLVRRVYAEEIEHFGYA